ncbi:MAG: triose-phosphate isomerase [Synergistaceae bacterium]|nr:triose-phosphate isomerase [Synergistaceae bacterium]
MRRKFIAGNWKMFNGPKATSEFINKFSAEIKASPEVIKAVADGSEEIALFVPAISLTAAADGVKELPVIIGAQNCHWEKNGAFTGEISVPMITEVGATHVLIGHSERRHIFREINEELNKKVQAAVEGGLVAVLCVGELLEEREAGRAFDVIREQFIEGLKGIDAKTAAEKIIIAYEPVWAIGTGKTAGNDDAEEICGYIRKLTAERFDGETADKIIILYGGSVKPENTKGIISQPDIDGVLVGGASLKPESFIQIVKNAL